MMDKIPAEIILQIGKSSTRHDYYQMVLVSKFFYSFFISELYHHVRLPMNQYEEGWYGRLSH